MPDDRRSEQHRECPWCAERILAKAIICRVCGRDVQPAQSVKMKAEQVEFELGESPASLPHDAVARHNDSQSPLETKPAAVKSEGGRPEGVKNWLAFFALGQIIVVVWGLFALWSDARELATWSARGITAASDAVAAVWVFDACAALMATASFVLLLLMFRRNPLTPRVALIVLPASAVLALFSAVSITYIRSVRATGADTNDLPLAADAVRTIVYALVWTLYWCRSKRVRNTFGSNGARSSMTVSVPALRSARNIGVAVSSAVCLILGLSVTSGLMRARNIVVAANEPPTSPDQTFDEQAVLAKNIRDQGGNADSLYRAHTGTDQVWFTKLSAAAAVTDLTDDERRELARLRALALDRLDVEDCAAYVMRGTGMSAKNLTAAENRRLVELAGVAVGRRISGKSVSRDEKIDDTRIGPILRKYGSEEDRQKLGMFSNGNASAAETCEGGKAIYRIVLDVPQGTAESSDATYWLLDLVSGR